MSNAIKVIGRDPFARHDVIRRRVDDLSGGCDWCGSLSPKGKLYQYGTEPDANPSRRSFFAGKFCSRGCCKTYREH